MADQTAQKSVVKVEDPKQLEINNWKEFVEKWRKISLKAVPYGAFLFLICWFFPFKYWFFMFVFSFIPLISWYFSHSFKEVKTWEKMLVFRKGDVYEQRASGKWWFTKWPKDRTVFVKVYERRIDVPPQEIIIESGLKPRGKQKLDKVSVTVDSIFYFKIKKDEQSVINSVTEVQDIYGALKDLFIFTLRQVCAAYTPDELIGEIKKSHTEVGSISNIIKTAVEKEAETWGIEVTKTGIQDVQLPKEFKEAMNAVPAAERRRQTKIIDADAEARRIQREWTQIKKLDPNLELKSLEAITKFAEGKGSPIIFGGLKQFLRELLGKEEKK